MKTPMQFKVSSLRSGLLIMLVIGCSALAQSGGTFSIRRSTLSSGGGPSSAGQFQIAGTAGQAEAGVAVGGAIQLRGGFWMGASAPVTAGDSIFVNGFE